MNKSEKSCGVILHNDQKEYLIIRHLAGHWDFPKGHVEAGETEEATARRELWEETGLEAAILPGFRETVNYLVRGRILKEVVYFIGRPVGGAIRLQPEEVSDYRFLTYQAGRECLTFESNRQLLDKAQAWLEANQA